MDMKDFFLNKVLDCEDENTTINKERLIEGYDYIKERDINTIISSNVIKELNYIITKKELHINCLRYTKIGEEIHYYPYYLTYQSINDIINKYLKISFYVDMCNSNEIDEENKIRIASKMVFILLQFHFFGDGNGRTAHLLFNKILQGVIGNDNFFFCNFKRYFIEKKEINHEPRGIYEYINASYYFSKLYNECDDFCKFVKDNIEIYQW